MLQLHVDNNFMARSCSASKAISAVRIPVVLFLLLMSLECPQAHGGSVAVVLNESLNESMDRITGSGHTAVYFSNICADSPVRLRLCHPGELGSVMSTYINIGEDQSYEWNIVPLSVYLYGVEDPRNRPIFGSYKIKRALEERYRERYLSEYCRSSACRTSPKAEWREMVAATLVRGVYLFVVDSTVEQDQQLIAEFNDSANRNHFNGITRNCADFTRHIINTYFPHAVRPDYINDFGMTSPKAVARTFTRYAHRHPESNFRVLHFPQVPGTIKRSSEVRSGTEQLYRSKKLLFPMILFADHELPFVAASYLLTARFSPEREFEKHPATELGVKYSDVLAEPAAVSATSEPAELVGTSKEWKRYRKSLAFALKDRKDVVSRRDLAHFFNDLDQAGTVSVDSDGSAWIEISKNGEPLAVGVSASNNLVPGSNPQLAYTLLLARTSRILKSPNHRRETLLEFRQDWANLQQASKDLETLSAGDAAALKTGRSMIVPGGGED